eukprot:3351839-Ditylum_brightwellii.AAC.1
MQEMWQANAEEDSWGILLVHARNAFNEINRRAMLWSICHLWPATAMFAFNTYRHWRKLVLRSHDNLVLSKERVTQGDPLAMI